MTPTIIRLSGLALVASLAFPAAAFAQDVPDPANESRQSVTVSAESQDYTKGYGSLRSVKIEYRVDFADTTVTFTPTIGQRRVSGGSVTALGADATIYHDWSDTISTRTRAFIAENQPVFANLDFAQDVSVKLADKTVATVGARWARYFGNQDVWFVSGGLRQYFKGGSVAYRLTWVKPENRDAFLAQLVSLTVNDGRGRGKTQLWANYGGASFDRALDSSFTGKDYGGLVQRIQPIDKSLSLSLSAGLESYARPAGRVEGTKLGLGLQFSLD
ncbi:YaiO family outer membrane beta-barrel protein [Sphingomonas bacterium]|uniref:YaiO family outer membrane beta-barrel protein n=1 Tax=Sphingomonas bacterium TaxID=1895847 RepID=UPI002606FC8A|nr:YaiO family outer membrane beta-barrel protein [Sphingomonas bacterium]MDB5678806.1 yaiO [Sphingomonas bacterium]